MAYPLVHFLALTGYLGAGVWLWHEMQRAGELRAAAKTGIRLLVLAAWLLHGAVLYIQFPSGGAWNLSLTSAFSLVAWVVVALYLLAALTRPADGLGILVLPVAALTVLAEWLWARQIPLPFITAWQAAHIVISILAYSLLTLAAVQSLLLLVQEEQLRHKHPGGLIRALPPLETMETLLFQLIGLGFLLLTLTLVSGVFFSEAVFGQPLRFNHHMVLSLLAWVVYGILLFGHWRLGWRGRPAIRWTLAGFLLLVLAYFGSKFVLEVLLKRV